MSRVRLREIPWGQFPEGDFADFIAQDADRFALAEDLLRRASLEYRVADIAGNRHFFVTAGANGGADLPSPVALAAHYDRAPRSPGANDNSAAVFILVETAMRLKAAREDGWLVIFTDKEELAPGEAVKNQGAFTLASGLRESGLENPQIFCFDACGRGDTLVISTTVEHLLREEAGSERLRQNLLGLRRAALKNARELGLHKAILAPTPFSDDLGFFRAGLAAQTITMLPAGECAALVSRLRRNPRLADALIMAEERAAGPDVIPETWRGLNSPNDTSARLTPENFGTVVQFARNLVGRRNVGNKGSKRSAF